MITTILFNFDLPHSPKIERMIDKLERQGYTILYKGAPVPENCLIVREEDGPPHLNWRSIMLAIQDFQLGNTLESAVKDWLWGTYPQGPKGQKGSYESF